MVLQHGISTHAIPTASCKPIMIIPYDCFFFLTESLESYKTFNFTSAYRLFIV